MLSGIIPVLWVGAQNVLIWPLTLCTLGSPLFYTLVSDTPYPDTARAPWPVSIYLVWHGSWIWTKQIILGVWDRFVYSALPRLTGIVTIVKIYSQHVEFWSASESWSGPRILSDVGMKFLCRLEWFLDIDGTVKKERPEVGSGTTKQPLHLDLLIFSIIWMMSLTGGHIQQFSPDQSWVKASTPADCGTK